MFKEWVLCDFCCIILPSWSLSTLSSSIIIYHHLHKVPKGMPGRVSYRFSYTPLRIEGIIIYVFLWAVIKTLLTFHWFVDRDPKILADYKPYKTWVVFHPPTPYPNQPGCCMITAHTMLVSPKKKTQHWELHKESWELPQWSAKWPWRIKKTPGLRSAFQGSY